MISVLVTESSLKHNFASSEGGSFVDASALATVTLAPGWNAAFGEPTFWGEIAMGVATTPWVVGAGLLYGTWSVTVGDNWMNSKWDNSHINFVKPKN